MLHPLTLALPLLFLPFGAQAVETVHGAVVFSRHGDRTAKVYPPTKLTTLGKNQLYDSGSFYRSRYIENSTYSIPGISYRDVSTTQIYAAAPDQTLLVTSGQAFLQGLYPPITGSSLSTTTESLANGSVISLPLEGYQYATIHTVSETDPDTIWLKGDDSCPEYTDAGERFYTSEQYIQLEASTKSFYESFSDILTGVFAANATSYYNAYAIFDYINVGMVHNKTIASRVSSEELTQLRTLADSHEFALNADATTATSPGALAVSGRTLVNKVMTQLASVISSKGKSNKISLLVGSYDTFLSIFALMNLPAVSTDFTGLPDYGSTIAFELLSYNDNTDFPTSSDELYVRFLLRNGTTTGITEYPIFNRALSGTAMPWSEFSESMSDISVSTVKQWCQVCGSTESFCPVDSSSDEPDVETADNKSKISTAVAGVIGAVVALAVVGLLLAVAMVGCGVRFASKKRANGGAEKSTGDSDSDSDSGNVAFPSKV